MCACSQERPGRWAEIEAKLRVERALGMYGKEKGSIQEAEKKGSLTEYLLWIQMYFS